MLCPVPQPVSVPLPVSLLCNDLPAVLCWEGHAREEAGPRFVERLHDVDGVCAAMTIEFVPSPTLVYRSVSTFPPTYPERGSLIRSARG